MSPKCTFQLNKTYEIYGSGELVDGSITLNLTNPESFNAIHISLKGHGCVSWKETEEKRKPDGTGTITETTEFRADDLYAQLQQDLMGEGNLEAGEHMFAFALQLPDDCPGSFEGSLGSIRYHLAVVVVTKARLKVHFNYDINVEKRDDLNLHPEYKIPVQAEETKTFCWIACTEGRILFTLTTPFGAYTPLQKLRYILRVENQSMSDVQGYEVAIQQDTTYTARTPHFKKRFESDNIVNVDFDDKCLKLTTRIFEGDIQIPAVAPSAEGGDNSIINIEYRLVVTAFIPGCTLDSQIIMPFHIGTIALEESLQAGRATDVVDATPSAPPLPSTSSAGVDRPPEYQSIKPPTFSEAVKNGQMPPSFDSAITASAPAYESIVNGRNRPFIGFRVPE